MNTVTLLYTISRHLIKQDPCDCQSWLSFFQKRRLCKFWIGSVQLCAVD